MTTTPELNDKSGVYDANYRNELDPRYANNPYIRALPALPDDRALAKALTNLPPFNPEERSLPASTRIQRLDTLREVLVGLPRVVRLARAMMKMMTTGYGPRRPYSTDDNQRVRDLYALQQSGQFVSVKQTELAAQHSMSLIGASGCGKSFSLRHIAGMFPSAIYHPEMGRWQLPFVFLEMAWDGASVHTMASGLFAEYDRLLPDGHFTELYMERKGLNAEQRLAKALALGHMLGVGQIIVDEGQNQTNIGNGRKTRERKSASANAVRTETPLTKLLITASNTSHIPILFSGTLEMQNMLGSRFTRARRMAGRGSALWLPLERPVVNPEGKNVMSEFELLFRALLRYQWIRNPIDSTNKEQVCSWANIFFDFCQGIPDILVKLFESAQEAAIAGGAEVLTPELVQRVFQAEFVMTAFGLKAVRDKDDTLGEAVPDLYSPNIMDLWDDVVAEHAEVPTTTAAPKSAVAGNDAAKIRTTKPPLKSPKPMPLDVKTLAQADMRNIHRIGAAEVGGPDETQPA